MTELQTVEFEILRAFDAVCHKLQIPYFLVCGSALGAARHQGFIPWDDDLDVAMYRADYERFLEEAPALLPEHLFLQHYKSDPAFPQIYAKLRDSRTTYIEQSTAHLNMHHGIYIDIFPLDGYPENPFSKACLEFRKRVYSAILFSATEIERSPRAKCIAFFLRLFGFHKRSAKSAGRYSALISKYPPETSALIANHGNWQGALEYAPREQYKNGAVMLFEGMQVRVPEHYDAYLTQKYGDWRKLPEKDKRHGHHFYTVCDPKTPYTKFKR